MLLLITTMVIFIVIKGSNKHGAGIGLVICKKLVGLLGPTDMIAVES